MPKPVEQKSLYQQVREVTLNRGRVVVYNQWTRRRDSFLARGVTLPVWVQTLIGNERQNVAVTAIAHRFSYDLPATVELSLSNVPEILVLNGDLQRIFRRGRISDSFLRNATPQDIEFWTPYALVLRKHPMITLRARLPGK